MISMMRPAMILMIFERCYYESFGVERDLILAQ